MGEKKILAFFVVFVGEFRMWSGSQNRIPLNIERESPGDRIYYFGTYLCFHHKEDKSTFN